LTWAEISWIHKVQRRLLISRSIKVNLLTDAEIVIRTDNTYDNTYHN